MMMEERHQAIINIGRNRVGRSSGAHFGSGAPRNSNTTESFQTSTQHTQLPKGIHKLEIFKEFFKQIETVFNVIINTSYFVKVTFKKSKGF